MFFLALTSYPYPTYEALNVKPNWELFVFECRQLEFIKPTTAALGTTQTNTHTKNVGGLHTCAFALVLTRGQCNGA